MLLPLQGRVLGIRTSLAVLGEVGIVVRDRALGMLYRGDDEGYG